MAIEKNSELLFLYDAKQTNPNGDMDDENKPRMDHETETNLVSDVRLKRYVRDYLEDFKGEELFITDKAKDSKERAKQLQNTGKKQKDCIDVKYFGAVLAEEGASDHFTGPIQFNWGYSLNKVELQETKTITSKFNSQEGVGKDFRVKYSFIAFSGNINANNTSKEEDNKVNLKPEEVNLFDEALIKSIPLNRTRSKIGQMPRLYLRVELKNNQEFLKDLREFIRLDREKDYNSIDDVQLDLNELGNYLKRNESKIEKIYYFKDENLKITGMDFGAGNFQEIEI